MNEIYGAIIGDVVGSTYETDEMNAHKKAMIVPFSQRIKVMKCDLLSLFKDGCEITDDSILTVAVANAILTNMGYEENLKKFGLDEIDYGVDKYGRSRFGKNFTSWIKGESDQHSYGNGCAMRVSPVGLAFDTLQETLIQAEKSAKPTHDMPDCIKLTRATAGAIFLARNGKTKKEIKKFVEQEIGFELNFNINDLRHHYIFSAKAINSIPQALFCFLKSKSFEDCLKLTISIGGDADTTAAISCAIAAAFYGIPQTFLNEVKKYLPKKYLQICEKFNQKYGKNSKN